MSQELQMAKKPRYLAFQVRFLLGRYHGKEWPPSPRRLFLAFVAALHQNSGRVEFHRGDKALKFFEKFGPPKIYAHRCKGCEYTIFVPNNDGDVISKAYAEGKEPKDEKTMTTGKTMKPYITETATYVWEIPHEEPDSIETLCELAKEIPVLGWGIDPVAVHGSVRESPHAADGQCYVIDEQGSERIEVPAEGLLEDARRHHGEFESRVSGDSFYKPSPIRKYHTQRYRTHTPSPDIYVFRIFDAAGNRGALTSSQIPLAVEQLYRMKNEYNGNSMLHADAVVMPTLGQHSDGIVRRIAFLISHKTDEGVRDRFLSHVSGQFVKIGDVEYQIRLEDSNDPVQKMYKGWSRRWCSVTPVDLNVGKEQNVAKDKTAADKASRVRAHRELRSDVAEAAIAALGKDGITGDVAFVDSRKEPYWNGLPRATGRTAHLEIEFKAARKGAFIIGKNKKGGFGLFAPSEMPKAVYFTLLGDRLPIEKTIDVADLMRRAAMSKFQRLFGRSNIPAVISGHSSEPLNHSHALWLPYDADADGFIDHVAVYARYGFGRVEMQALSGITDMFDNSTRMRLHFNRFDGMVELGQKCSLFARSQKWKSVTPYYTPWHMKKKTGIKDQIEKEMSRDVESVRVDSELVVVSHRNIKTPTRRFKTMRNGKGPITSIGRSLEINFKEPFTGPLALGYGKHFGLGLFVPTSTAKS